MNQVYCLFIAVLVVSASTIDAMALANIHCKLATCREFHHVSDACVCCSSVDRVKLPRRVWKLIRGIRSMLRHVTRLYRAYRIFLVNMGNVSMKQQRRSIQRVFVSETDWSSSMKTSSISRCLGENDQELHEWTGWSFSERCSVLLWLHVDEKLRGQRRSRTISNASSITSLQLKRCVWESDNKSSRYS